MNTTVAGDELNQDATGFGDPMVEVGINLIGPKAIKNIPDLLRYEPKFSLDVIVDVAFPIGEYDNRSGAEPRPEPLVRARGCSHRLAA